MDADSFVKLLLTGFAGICAALVYEHRRAEKATALLVELLRGKNEGKDRALTRFAKALERFEKAHPGEPHAKDP